MTPAYDTDPAEKYLSLNWDWRLKKVDEDGDSYWEVTIGEIPDFLAIGDSKTDALVSAREALLSHLRGYLVTNKPIPFPGRAKTARYEIDRVALVGV